MLLFKFFLSSLVFLSHNSASFKNVGVNTNLRRFIHMRKDRTLLYDMPYKPRGKNQEDYVRLLNDNNVKVLFVTGPAGTGKTMFACSKAISDLKSGAIDKIVITRPVVPVEEDIGFLPGTLVKKMDPWTRPMFDIFLESFPQKDIDTMVKNNIIEISPLAYMRGRTFKNAFIIADEMQNSSPNQMLMLTTRIGDKSKMVITGDMKQTDKGTNSGLSDFINKYKAYESFYFKKNAELLLSNSTHYYQFVKETGIKIVEMENKDIERSPVVTKILDIYDIDNLRYNMSIKYSNVKNLIKPGVTDNITNTTLIKEIIASKLANQTVDNIAIVDNNSTNTNNTTEIKGIKLLSSDSNNDAALIPLHHQSNRFNTRK